MQGQYTLLVLWNRILAIKKFKGKFIGYSLEYEHKHRQITINNVGL